MTSRPDNKVNPTGGDGAVQRATAAQRKLAASLQQTRHRRDTGLFAIEGTRAVTDTLGLFHTEMILATPAWLGSDAAKAIRHTAAPVLSVSESEMERLSAMKTPQGVVAVCRIPVRETPADLGTHSLVLALDDVQDPGNLGTIIRVADWFGVRTILASRNTVDAFNPKVVQATMGALARVGVHYVDLADTLAKAAAAGTAICGTLLDGENIYRSQLPAAGIVVMGNEGNGLSQPVRALLTHRLLIPPYPAAGADGVESLNVAMATGIVLSEFRRRM